MTNTAGTDPETGNEYCPLCGDDLEVGQLARRCVARARKGQPNVAYHDSCIRNLTDTEERLQQHHPRLYAAEVFTYAGKE